MYVAYWISRHLSYEFRSKIMKTKQHKLINGRWVIKTHDALQASSFDIYINTHRKLETVLCIK
jgi:hypothetical protein